MSGYNKVILMGNLTKDPEIRYTPNGTAVANFSIAVNRRYKINNEVKDEVSFLDIVVFGKSAENCGQYINKGDSILVEGRLQQRRWETEDGQKRSKIEIVAQSVQFMSKKQGSSQGFSGEESGMSNSSGNSFGSAGGNVEEEVPF